MRPIVIKITNKILDEVYNFNFNLKVYTYLIMYLS